MSLPEGSHWPAASRKRRLLGAYLDFLMIGAPLTAALWALAESWPALREASFPIRFTIFLLIESILLVKVRWSPGLSSLGVIALERSPFAFPSDPQTQKPLYVVDPRIFRNERWWTILFGVLAILDGAKMVVRWTMFHVPMPFMGLELTPVASVALQLLMGTGEIIMGIGVLRLRGFALPVGVSFYGVQLASLVASWSLLPGWVAEYTVARRALRGLPPRPGEMDFMQKVMPAGFAVVALAALVWLALVARRIRRAGPS